MNLIKQVISDLCKEAGWVLFYGILTSIVIMTFILISISYSYVASQNGSITRFINSSVTFTQLKSTDYNTDPAPAPVSFDPAETESMDDYFTDVFSEDGNAGTYVMMPGRFGYQQVIILMGIYADYTPFSQEQTEPVTFAVSYDQEDVKPDIISFAGNDYPLYTAPSNMEIYHPLFYMSSGSGMLDDTLFVFSHDYRAVQDIFPSSQYWELKDDAFIERLIFESPADEDIARMRNVITKNTGRYVSVQTVSEFLKSSAQSGLRTHRTYMLFYIIASLALTGAMLMNIYRTLKRKIPGCTIHHLYGASGTFIFLRMFLFILLYNAIPLAGTLLIMKLNRIASPLNLFMTVLAVFAVLFAVTVVVYSQFQVQFSQGLGRE